MKKMNIKKLVPAKDVLQEEMEAVKGGWELHLCFSGCKTGDKGNQGSSTTPSKPTTSSGSDIKAERPSEFV